MPTPIDKSKRRVPGETYTYGQAAIAELIRNTYMVEKNRYTAAVRPTQAQGQSPAFGDRLKPAVTASRAKTHASVEDEIMSSVSAKPKSNVWLRIADFCIKRMYDPEKYVRYQFLNLGNQGRRATLPTAEHLMTPAAVTRYLAGLGDLTRELQSAFDVQRSTFEIEAAVIRQRLSCRSDQDAWYTALNDVSLPLTALFRYCLARSIRDQESLSADVKNTFHNTVRRFAVAAAVQYVYAEEAYDQVWKEWIPPDFKAQAKAQYWKSHNMRQQGRSDG